MDWFRHDLTMETDPKVAGLIRRFGYEGFGLFCHVLPFLYQNKGEVPKEEILDELKDCSNNGEEVFRYMIKKGLLHENSEGTITSNRVMRELEAFAEISAKRAAAGRKGGFAKSKATQDKCQANAKQMPNFAKQNVAQTNIQTNVHTSSVPDISVIPDKDEDTRGVVGGKVSSPSSIKETAAFQGVRAHYAIADYQAKFNAIEGVVKCTRLTVEREMAVDAILRHFTVEEIDRTFEKIAQSTFLRGDNRKGFKITFDWLFQIDNFTKVLEGNYDSYDNGKKAATPQRTNKMIEDPEERKRMNQYDPRTGRPLTPEEIAEKERRIREEEEDFERRMKARRENHE